MDIVTQSLELTRNRDDVLRFAIALHTGGSATLAGVTGEFVIDGHDGTALVTINGSAVAVTSGQVDVSIDKDDTASITPGVYPFSLVLTDSQGDETTAAEGYITIKSERV